MEIIPVWPIVTPPSRYVLVSIGNPAETRKSRAHRFWQLLAREMPFSGLEPGAIRYLWYAVDDSQTRQVGATGKISLIGTQRGPRIQRCQKAAIECVFETFEKVLP